VRLYLLSLEISKYDYVYADLILSIITGIIVLYYQYRYYYYIDTDVSKDDVKYGFEVIQKISFDKQIRIAFILGGIIALQYTRVLLIFQANKYFGRMLKVIIYMLADVFKFLVIFIIILITFSSAGRILFFDIDEFDTIQSGALFLIQCSLGDFDFSIFDQEGLMLSKYYGITFLLMYLTLTNVTLLNFLIAILSDTYSILQGNSEGLYTQQIIKIRCVLQDNKHYSSLVSCPVPLNIFLLPFCITVMFSKNEMLNYIVLHICFIPTLVIGIATFIIFSLILLPFSYISIIVKQTVWIKHSKHKLRDLGILALFILFGLGYLVVIIGFDLVSFVASI
jgi:hypothetical protein